MIRLLLVDDIAEVRQGLRTVLPLAGEAMGLALEIAGEASNGAEAVQLTDLIQPDAILMDLEMPVLDGFAAAVEIRKTNPTVRLIALTVHSDQAIRQAALQAGFDGFFQKGVPLEQLIRSISSL